MNQTEGNWRVRKKVNDREREKNEHFVLYRGTMMKRSEYVRNSENKKKSLYIAFEKKKIK